MKRLLFRLSLVLVLVSFLFLPTFSSIPINPIVKEAHCADCVETHSGFEILPGSGCIVNSVTYLCPWGCEHIHYTLICYPYGYYTWEEGCYE